MAAALLTATAGGWTAASGPRIPAAGDPAPPFALPDLEGREVALAACRGKVVVLHFWATWCTPCRHEMPILDGVLRRHTDQVIGLGINLGEKAGTVRAFREEAGLTFPLLLDRRGRVAAAYGVRSLPITILLGPDGRVAGSVAMGALTADDLEARIAALLPRGQEPPPPR